MRIIAGEYGGRILRTVDNPSVRPATDRVRESLFNILNNRIRIAGAKVLDLFAGSGSVGIEALSRGAERAVFVEQAYPAVRVIEENLRMLGESASRRAEVIRGNAFRYIKESIESFDLVFVDPPYALKHSEMLPILLVEHERIARNGIMVMEHTKKFSFPSSPKYIIDDQRVFGMTVVSFILPTRMDKEL
ncbi:MAG: 16S rRNA (guanine(966)-N(2))-methyltransferase RsmD [Bacteroidota bacterium]